MSSTKRCLARAVALLATSIVACAGTAQAVVISATPNADLNTPYTLSLGDGAASYTFTGRNTPFNDPIGVMTGGAARVSSLGVPFNDPPQPTSYFPPQTFGPNDGILYTAYPDAPGQISTSTADVFIGLEYMLDDGAHYGYARVFGFDADANYTPTLAGFGYQTDPNTPIVTGEQGSGQGGGPGVAPVPEPSSFALAVLGFGLLASMLAGRKRRQSAGSTANG